MELTMELTSEQLDTVLRALMRAAEELHMAVSELYDTNDGADKEVAQVYLDEAAEYECLYEALSNKER